MRGLEHYLNDIMRPPPDSTDVKGQFAIFINTNEIKTTKCIVITQTVNDLHSPLDWGYPN